MRAAATSATSAIPAPSALPWRKLAWALLLSLLVHMLFLSAVNSSFSLRLKGKSEIASINTRMIESRAQDAKADAPVAAKPPAAPPSPEAAATARPNAPSALPPPDVKEKPAPAPAESAPIAPEKIAETLPAVSETLPPATATAATPSAITAQEQGGNNGDQIERLQLQYPGNMQLQFNATVKRGLLSLQREGLLVWKSDGREYDLKIEAPGLLLQTSVGKLGSTGLAPDRFGDKRLGGSERATHFRHEIGKIQFSNNRPDVELQSGAQDRASFFLQLAGLLAGNAERYERGSKIIMQVASVGDAPLWELQLMGMEELTLPAGKLKAIKLQRMPRGEYDQRVEIWFAPSLGYAPVRILLSSPTEPERDYIDLSLRSLP